MDSFCRKMYLGESFNALVIVLNESSNTAKDVQLKVSERDRFACSVETCV